ncbi:ribosome-associated heat shock protein Hsp15 [Lewinella aquimaris]|uniref:Ribosome-associated heat shock protein Hsp15 n=1 Tax=Neolewinella aquimaris TaxID=1835722 RepID=A0A840E8C3_9BACT|nr:RNA-binding S4 domain-containing protein [Neolewinella aquimaris]MBB4078318.1 ribosome-associated heat shock protein Hsp15 [Neolewinella aquimaris]
MDKVRIDKWLWAVRIFKSRTLATDVVKKGRVKLRNEPVKPSTNVTVGDRLTVVKEGFNLELEVVKLLNKRVGAPLAVTCYINHTTEEEMNKYKDWFVGKTQGEFREKGSGRPTKRERRTIETFKDDILWDDED